LVDDEVAITRALAMYLTEHGDFIVRMENEGSRAVNAAREFKPDLILLDIMMPDADGPTIAAEIRADPALRNTPIVFLTALVSRNEIGMGTARIGGYPFLAKPVSPDTILACIAEHARVPERA